MLMAENGNARNGIEWNTNTIWGMKPPLSPLTNLCRNHVKDQLDTDAHWISQRKYLWPSQRQLLPLYVNVCQPPVRSCQFWNAAKRWKKGADCSKKAANPTERQFGTHVDSLCSWHLPAFRRSPFTFETHLAQSWQVPDGLDSPTPVVQLADGHRAFPWPPVCLLLICPGPAALCRNKTRNNLGS